MLMGVRTMHHTGRHLAHHSTKLPTCPPLCSIWDTFARQVNPATGLPYVYNNETGDVADDFYHVRAGAKDPPGAVAGVVGARSVGWLWAAVIHQSQRSTLHPHTASTLVAYFP